MTRDILLGLIDPDPSQARKTFDEGRLDELAQSMAANGLAVPVLVRPGQDGRYVLVHGERRWRAAGRLGWETIPAEVRELEPEQARWLALVENIQRADLSPIEEAGAFQAALSEGLTQTELGKRLGKSQSYIAQKLRLLTLPAPLQVYLDRRALSEGHARQLLRLRGVYGPDLLAPGRWQEAWAPCLDAAYWQESCMVFALLRDLRPLDQPVCFADLLTDKNEAPAVLSAGCHALSVWWAEAGQVPQWAVVAFWYGSFVAHYSLSVADLTMAIANFLELLYAAILYTHDSAPSGKTRQARLEAWGYRSDLRHAGLWQDGARCVPRDLELAALVSVAKQESHALPSNCQSYGAGAAAWEYAGLKDSIAEHGILVPVDVDEKGAILDGRKRVKAWHELRAEGVDVPDYPRLVRGGMTEEDKRDHRAELNKPRLPQAEVEQYGLIGGRPYADFWQELAELRDKLDQAQTFPEVKTIQDRAATLQQEAAEFRLDNARAAGQALAELKALEAAQP